MDGMVERCELAPDLTVSRVLTGLWQLADMERDGDAVDAESTAATMEPYVAAGLTTFDMADHYGSAELVAGAFLEKHSSGNGEFFTKWVPKPGRSTRQEVREAVDRALGRMRTDQIDLLQFHAWNYADPSWLDCLFWLQELADEGLIRHLGLTNFDTAHFRIVLNSGIRVVSNQVCYSLIDQRARGAMSELCREYRVHLLAFGTVAGGFLTDKWLGKPEPSFESLQTWSEMKYLRFIQEAGGWESYQNLLSTAANVASRLGVSIPNIACRTILDDPAVAGVIIGARLGRAEHIKENLRLFEFELDEESRSEIDDAMVQMSPIPGDCGDEYRRPPFLTATGDLSHHIESLPDPFVPETDRDGRTRVSSGTPWEQMAGYSRAVRVGDRISVAGTTASHGSRTIGGGDPAAQAHFVIDKIEGAIASLGGRLGDVIRTRVFVKNLDDWEPIARVHGERFRDIKPANTLVQAALIGDDLLVEIEAEAVVAGQDVHS